MEKRREVEKDLNEQLVSRNAPDMKAKQRDYHEAQQRLKSIEQQLGKHLQRRVRLDCIVLYSSISIVPLNDQRPTEAVEIAFTLIILC